MHLLPARPPPSPIYFDITKYGPTGVNYSNPNHTVWAGSSLYYDATAPFRAAIAAAAAAARASETKADQIVFLPSGQYHIQGTVLGFERNVALEDAIGSHACSLEAIKRVTNVIPLEDTIGSHACSLEAIKRVTNSIPLESPLEFYSYRLSP
jgi:hypothetical protein